MRVLAVETKDASNGSLKQFEYVLSTSQKTIIEFLNIITLCDVDVKYTVVIRLGNIFNIRQSLIFSTPNLSASHSNMKYLNNLK